MPDALTGLQSACDLFEEFAPRDLASRESRVLVFIDIGGMAHVTGVLGFQAGDAILRRISRLLIIYWPTWRTARVGGDEFALVAPDMRVARDAASRLQRLMAHEFQSERAEVRANAAASGVTSPQPRLLHPSFVLVPIDPIFGIRAQLQDAQRMLRRALGQAEGAAVLVSAN